MWRSPSHRRLCEQIHLGGAVQGSQEGIKPALSVRLVLLQCHSWIDIPKIRHELAEIRLTKGIVHQFHWFLPPILLRCMFQALALYLQQGQSLSVCHLQSSHHCSDQCQPPEEGQECESGELPRAMERGSFQCAHPFQCLDCSYCLWNVLNLCPALVLTMMVQISDLRTDWLSHLPG